MKHQLLLLVLTAFRKYDVGAQIQYYENNTIMVPLWHLLEVTKPEWRNFSPPTTGVPLNWIQYHTYASIRFDLLRKMISTTGPTLEPTTPFPMFSFGTDRIIYNLSAEAEMLKKNLEFEYELENNMSLATEPHPIVTESHPSPRIFNVYKGVYLKDSSLEKIFWNKTYYEKYNRSINWSKKKAFWKKTPTTPTTEWPLINVTKIGDWERISFKLNDISYWEPEQWKEEYEHMEYMEHIKRLNKTATRSPATAFIKLLANTRIASLWRLHSLLPFIHRKTTLKPPDTAEMRDLVYSDPFPVPDVISLEHESAVKNESDYSFKYSYDYRDLSVAFGERARQNKKVTKLWDSRYYAQNFPHNMLTKQLIPPTSPDPWDEWIAMDTWKRREYVLRGWDTARPPNERTRASPHVFTAHPDPTVYDYFDYEYRSPLTEFFNEDSVTLINSREVSKIIWSEKQAISTSPRSTTTDQPPMTLFKVPKKRKIWTTPRSRNIARRKQNRTMSQQELKRKMRERYKKINEARGLDKMENEDGEPGGTPDPKAKDAWFDKLFELKITKLPPTKEPLKEYQCHICLKELSSKGGYQRHINTHKRMGQWLDPFA